MSFLTDIETDQLRLARVSLHILGEGAFERQPEMPVEHDDFLLELLTDVASASVYSFAEVSSTRDKIEAIAQRKVSFEAGAQDLAADFHRFHASGTVKDGAFFVFELAVDDERVAIYALIKYDYSQALEIVERDGATGLRRIVEAFVRDRVSIQKAAMIRCIDGKAENAISTRDRMGRPSPNLTDFFHGFLQVVRDRNDEDLTREVKDLIRTVLIDNREDLPDGKAAHAIQKALDVIRDAPEVNEEVINQAVWVGAGRPDDDAVKDRLNISVQRVLKRKRLAGLAFKPHQETIAKTTRTIVKTQENVVIEYDTKLLGSAVTREEIDGGLIRFTVTTGSYSDGVVAERTRR